MRVVQLVPSLDVGGAERVAALLADDLRARGHEVALVSMFDAVGSWIEADLRAGGIPLRFLAKRPGLDLRTIPRLARVLRELRPDVLHTHLHVLKYALPAKVVWPGCAVVHTLHNLAEREVEPQSQALQRYAFRGAVAPVAIGDAVAESVQRLYGFPARAVIPNGIPTRAFHPRPGARERIRGELGLSPDVPVLLAVGRLNPQKNHAALLDALADPRVAATGAHLVLAGEGELLPALREQGERLGVTMRLHLLGVRGDIPDLLAAADVFALSSSWEGNPLAVMEAMAAGLPLVATAVGCVPELVTEPTGRLVPAGDTPALAAALASLAADAPLRRALGAAAARRATERFDVSQMGAAYETLYVALRDRRGRADTPG